MSLNPGNEINDRITIEDCKVRNDNVANDIKFPIDVKVYVNNILENTVNRNNKEIAFNIVSESEDEEKKWKVKKKKGNH